MSVILVAEEDAGSAEQVATVLQSEGWRVEIVPSRNEALHAAAVRQPALLLASTTLTEASSLLAAFSRRRGGPGSIALVAQAADLPLGPRGGGAGQADEDYQADALVAKPCSPQALVRTVRQFLAKAPAAADGVRPAGVRSAGPPAAGVPAAEPRGGQQLTSADIFGDVLAEVEAETQREKSARRSRTRRTQAEDIERRLEETLSGVIPVDGKRRRAAGTTQEPAAPAPPPAAPAPPPAATATPDGPRPTKRSLPTANEIDDLLDKTLSSLDMSSRTQRPKTSAARPTAAPQPEAALKPAAAPKPVAAPRPEAPVPEVRRSRDRPPPPAAARPAAIVPGAARPRAAPPEAAPPEATPPKIRPPMPEPAPRAAPPVIEPPPAARPQAPAASEPAAAPPPHDAVSAIPAPAAAGADPGSGLPILTALPGESFKTQRLPVIVVDSQPAAAADRPIAEPPVAERRIAERRIAERWETADDKTFGEYTLLERVAVGGMAEVWRARRRGVEGFQKTVAIKKILAHLIDSPDFVNMFIDEAKLAAQLNHNNIIQIYDLGKVGGDFFIAMEYVDGKDLRSILNAAKETGHPPPLGMALLIVGALARALDYAHRKRDFDNRELGLVHRDVSPQNVLISYEGEIKLCDFGIVKAVSKASTTQMGALKGKLQYMSPEQAWGRSVDARSDIFSLGSVLFEVLTGTKLFAGDSEIGVLDAVRECRVRSPREILPAIPESVEQIVLRALAKSPEDRYPTAGEMEHDLKSVLDGIKPPPGLKDLAAYLDSLSQPPAAVTGLPRPAAAEEDGILEAAAATPTPAGRTPAGRTPEAWTPPAVEPEGRTPEGRTPEAWTPPAVEPEGRTPGGRTPQASPAEVQEVRSPAPTGRGGKKWLVAAAAVILAVVLAGVGWLVFLKPTATGSASDPSDRAVLPPPALPTAPAAGGQSDVSRSEESQSGVPRSGSPRSDVSRSGVSRSGAPEAEGVAADSSPEDDAAAAGPFPSDLEEMVAEEVLKRREQIERDFEARKRQLEKEIEKAKEVTEPPDGPAAEAEEPAGGGGER